MCYHTSLARTADYLEKDLDETVIDSLLEPYDASRMHLDDLQTSGSHGTILPRKGSKPSEEEVRPVMKMAKLIALLVLTILLVLIVVQNTAPVQARFLWLTGEISAIVLLFLAAAGGFVLGLLVAILVRSGLKS